MLKFGTTTRFFVINRHNFGLQKVRLSKQNFSRFQAVSVSDVLQKWTKIFATNSISEPQESVENIVMHCLNISKFPELYKWNNRQLSQIEIDCIDTLCNRRMKHEPIPYIIGEWMFRNLILKMSPPVFIPRPETEQLIDLVLNEIDRKQCKHILELCCGSGAISLSLLAERADLQITAIDRSVFACQLTEHNAKLYNYHDRLNVIQHVLDVNNPKLPIDISECFDIIVANPPYIRSDIIPQLQPEIVMYEDLAALDGGRVDGLDLAKTIIKISSQTLNKCGKLFLELDPTQPALLQRWINANYPKVFDFTATYKDFCGKNRFVEITRND